MIQRASEHVHNNPISSLSYFNKYKMIHIVTVRGATIIDVHFGNPGFDTGLQDWGLSSSGSSKRLVGVPDQTELVPGFVMHSSWRRGLKAVLACMSYGTVYELFHSMRALHTEKTTHLIVVGDEAVPSLPCVLIYEPPIIQQFGDVIANLL